MNERVFFSNLLRVALFLLMFLGFSNGLKADTCNLSSITNIPDSVTLNFYPEKISKIDEASNTFEITYYLLYEYGIEVKPQRDCFFSLEKLPDNIFNPQLEIMQSEGDEYLSNFQVYILEDSIQVERKIRSNLLNSFDFRMFPFDQQSFQVQVMGLYSNDRLAMTSNLIDTDSFTNMSIEGWIKLAADNYVVKEIWDGSEYDRVVFSLNLERQSISIFVRVFTIIAIISVYRILLPEQNLRRLYNCKVQL